jgi:hypothetical protein
MVRLPEDVVPTAPDLHTRKARQQLAKVITRLFDHWQLPLTEQAALLGLSMSNRASVARYRRGEPLADSRDLLDRVSCLLGIHKALRILFPRDRDLAYRWITTENRRFGVRPIDIALKHGFEGLLMLRRYLEFERGS